MKVTSAVLLPYQAVKQPARMLSSENVLGGLRGQARCIQSPEEEEVMLHLLHHTVYVGGPFQIVIDTDEVRSLQTLWLESLKLIFQPLHKFLVNKL
jgi:hypothetical protein